MTTQIFVRDASGAFVGELDTIKQLDAIPRYRDVGSWSVQIPVAGQGDLALQLATPGYGVSVQRNGMTIISGPSTLSELVWDGVQDTVIVSGLSDEVALADRLIWPGTSPFTTIAYDAITGPGETVVKHYVANSRVSARQAAGATDITVASNLSRGGTVIGLERWSVLLAAIQSYALVAGIGFAVKDLVFDCYIPTDRTLEQVFSAESGNLVSYDAKTTAPTVTRAVVAGGGDLTARVIVIVVDNTAAARWGRHIEAFVDARDTSDVPTLTQRGATAIAKGQEGTQLTVKPIDVPNRSFGVDWNLGDTVTAQDVAGIVSQVHLTLNDKGELIEPLIDSSVTASATSVLRAFDELRALRTRMQNLERAQ